MSMKDLTMKWESSRIVVWYFGTHLCEASRWCMYSVKYISVETNHLEIHCERMIKCPSTWYCQHAKSKKVKEQRYIESGLGQRMSLGDLVVYLMTTTSIVSWVMGTSIPIQFEFYARSARLIWWVCEISLLSKNGLLWWPDSHWNPCCIAPK